MTQQPDIGLSGPKKFHSERIWTGSRLSDLENTCKPEVA